MLHLLMEFHNKNPVNGMYYTFIYTLFAANKTLQDGSVQYILDTVMEELSENVERKFIYVEMAFFSRWWKEQTNDMKEKV